MIKKILVLVILIPMMILGACYKEIDEVDNSTYIERHFPSILILSINEKYNLNKNDKLNLEFYDIEYLKYDSKIIDCADTIISTCSQGYTVLKIKITNRVNKKELVYELPITVVTEKQKQIYETDILGDYISSLRLSDPNIESFPLSLRKDEVKNIKFKIVNTQKANVKISDINKLSYREYAIEPIIDNDSICTLDNSGNLKAIKSGKTSIFYFIVMDDDKSLKILNKLDVEVIE